MPGGQSGLIRERIKTTSDRLVPQLSEVYEFSATPPADATTNQDKLDVLLDRLDDLLAYREKLATSLNVLYECHRDWAELQDKMTLAEREEEVAIQTEFMDEPNCNYVKNLDKVQDLLDKLRKKEVALKKAIRRLESLVRPSRTGSIPTAPTAPAATPPLPNLPQLDLPKFSGDVLRWTEFWDLYSSTV